MSPAAWALIGLGVVFVATVVWGIWMIRRTPVHGDQVQILFMDEVEDSEPTETSFTITGPTEFKCVHNPHAEPTAEQKRTPGRQKIKTSSRLIHTPFGIIKHPWSPPIPDGAKSAPWSRLHTFAEGVERQMQPRGRFMHEEPPIAFVCVTCDLQQPPLMEEDRTCPYCGIKLKVIGSRVFWWREAIDVQEWKP